MNVLEFKSQFLRTFDVIFLFIEFTSVLRRISNPRTEAYALLNNSLA